MKNELFRLLREYNLKPSHFLDQHFLIDESIINEQVEFANLSKKDLVLEIGPGLGFLTKKLCEKAGKVIAIESDERLIPLLKNEISSNNFELIKGDVLSVEIPRFTKCVSNLPYSISSQLTFLLLDKNFDLSVLMYQREFAERMMSIHGSRNYSRLSVSVQVKADVEYLRTVPPWSFFPRPKIHSALVRIIPSKKFDIKNKAFFDDFLRAIFQHKKKTLKNALIDSYHELKISKNEVKDFLSDIDIELQKKRPFQLTPREIVNLSNTLAERIS
ncbi:MAG: 16S rRNA (adenine(1518)-N(6)/adenine(1519)-N(6))-dimethyltransferase RsmA [Candidatus Hydrothermarchaeota archaeon]